MQMCEEMMKLRSGLDARKIPWVDASSVCSPEYIAHQAARGIDPIYADTTIYRTLFRVNSDNFSVIYGYGTYGGVDVYRGENPQKLECMTSLEPDQNPIGWLTADDIFKMIDDPMGWLGEYNNARSLM